MSAPKIRLESCDLVAPGLWRPDAATIRHLTKALRLYQGAVVEALSDAERRCATMRLVRRDGELLLEQCGEDRADAPDLPAIHLLLALLKADQLEPALRTCAELGAASVRLVICERSVPRYGADDVRRKMQRWRRLVAEATKVSGAARMMSLHEPIDMARLDWSALPRRRVAALLRDDAQPISQVGHVDDEIVIAIGPEGDWSDAEAESLIANDFIPISLGRRVLRASTAASAAVAYFRLA